MLRLIAWPLWPYASRGALPTMVPRSATPASVSINSSCSARPKKSTTSPWASNSRALGHRDDEDEVVAAVAAARGNQRFQPSPCRLIRRQQRFVEAAVPQRGFKPGNDGVLRRDLVFWTSGPTGSGGRHG